MKYLVHIFCLSLFCHLLISCGPDGDESDAQSQQKASSDQPQNSTSNANKLKQQTHDIMGIWYLNEWDLYHTIRFIDRQKVEFHTHIDTLLTYDYELRPDSLLIYNDQGKRLYINLIEKVGSDTLVFKNLMEKEGSQHYSRKRFKKGKEQETKDEETIE